MDWKPSQVGEGPWVHTARETLGVPGSSGTLPHLTAALTVSPICPHHPPSPGASRPILLHAYDSQPPPGQAETTHPLHPHRCPPLSLQAEPLEQSHPHPAPPGLWAACPIVSRETSSLLPAPVAPPPGIGHFLEASNLTASPDRAPPSSPPPRSAGSNSPL